ncbi:speriolin isoform X2 [Heterocephalus glaber]|uniref:Speriolin isoform X2 n=1 Tax=Heterocephalus glaber TaxID=10181 RepID=A0AAX6SBW3_HETGA|nr:speriolin isoform X2 [Heterocephalus glaber]
MSLLTNYEGLRHQIEKLVRENEELKKLVWLIQENQELRSAIKTQAGSINISGLTNGLGKVATGPAQHQAAANEPVLEEVGVVALAPLVDLLSSPQPNPLTGPLNILLSSPAPPGSQSSPFSSLLSGTLSSHLTGPKAVSPGGTLVMSLGLTSTGPLSSPVMVPMAVSPGGTVAGSLGLTSTGSLTPSSPLAGPLTMSKSSPLMAPGAGTVAISLSSPLLTSTAAPIGVSQNLPANPMSSLVLSEGPRVRLAEPLQGSPSGPPSSAGTGEAATSKALANEYPQPAQDPQHLSMTFMAAPLQASTPVGTVTPPGPTMAFSYGTSDVQAQPSAPQGQNVPTSVPTSPTNSLAGRVINSAPTPAPQAGAICTPLSTTHSTSQPPPTPHSPSRHPHTPPRTSSFPASVTDTRGSCTMEANRKSILELERKPTHRKTSKFPDGSRESKQLTWERLVGEIAFQLDRRILSSIFPERVRLYGFTVSNIPEKIIQASLNPNDHKLDEELCQTLTQRYVSIMNKLQSLGYNGRVHPALTEQLVNAYGILRERPELAASEGGSYTIDFLQHVLVETVHPSILTDALLLLSCLNQLAHDDGKPMFIW